MKIELFDILKITFRPNRLQKFLSLFKLGKVNEKFNYILVKDDTSKEVVVNALTDNKIYKYKIDRCELYRLKVKLSLAEITKLNIINDGSLTDNRILTIIRPNLHPNYHPTVEDVPINVDFCDKALIQTKLGYKKIYDSKKD